MAKVILLLLATVASAIPIVPPNAPPPIFGERAESYGTPSVAAQSAPSFNAPSASSFNAPSAPSFNSPSTPSYNAPSAPSYNAPSAPSYNAPQPKARVYQQSSEEFAPPKYTYDYAVQDGYSGVDFNQQESRDGYNTQGAYYVALPDTRRQKVSYYVNGDSGFVAEVSYEGEAQYPSVESQNTYRPEPQYQ